MSPLHRKLLRDLKAAKGQSLAIALLVACAAAANVGSATTFRSLRLTQQTYYERYRFADLWAPAVRAPLSLLPRAREIPGVSEMDARVSADATVVLEGFEEPVTARLVSVPASGEPRLGRLFLRSGRSVANPGEVLVSEGLALAHGLKPGDRIGLLVGGRRQSVRVVGVALSPEHVYVIRPGDLMPDDAHFGIIWAERDWLAAALDLQGAFNDLAVALRPEASSAAVRDALDRLLEPYGGTGAYGRDQQLSHRFVSDEIAQLEMMAALIPVVFLGVAAFLLSVVLSRMIAVQRQQIGTLKALGRGSAEIGAHYAGFAALIVGLGLIPGIAGGLLLGRTLTLTYVEFFRFPLLEMQAEPAVVAGAILLCFAAAALGTLGTVRRAVVLPPAEAMRPEPPASYRATFLERLGVGRLLSAPGRMVLRTLGRRPWRAALSTVGIAAAVATVVVGGYLSDSLEFLTRHQFERVQREDLSVSFSRPLSSATLIELRSLPGVHRAEPFRAAEAVLRAGARSYRTGILGLEPGARLRRVIDARGVAIELPPQGLLLSKELAEILDVRPGDRLRMELLEGRRRAQEVEVAGVVEDLLGVSGYVPIERLNAWLGEGQLVSGAYLSVAPSQQRPLWSQLRARPLVAGVALRASALESFRKTLAEHLGLFSGILGFFAAVIAGGVVYNTARVSLAERERELATLRVLGFTRDEALRMVLGELGVQVLLAIPLGCLLGRLSAQLLSAALESDLFRMPPIVTPASYAVAAGVVLVAAVAVVPVVRGWLGQLDLVSVLKTRE